MFCKKCYAELDAQVDPKCFKCGKAFDPSNSKTFLMRPFPTTRVIIAQIIATTIFGIICAFAVALHQAARTSGH